MIFTIELLGILTMCTIIFILIWGFVILNQILSQLKYKNYLMEKLTQHMYTLAQKDGELLESTNDE